MEWINFEAATHDQKRQFNEHPINRTLLQYDNGEVAFMSKRSLPRAITTHYVLLFAPPNSSSYACPYCGQYPSDHIRYKRKGKIYPTYANEHIGFNGDVNTHDWDETHYCDVCKKEFTFSNGT